MIQAPVLSAEAARTKVPFCDVSAPMEPVKGDPSRTSVQKAGHNATGIYLCGWSETQP